MRNFLLFSLFFTLLSCEQHNEGVVLIKFEEITERVDLNNEEDVLLAIKQLKEIDLSKCRASFKYEFERSIKIWEKLYGPDKHKYDKSELVDEFNESVREINKIRGFSE